MNEYFATPKVEPKRIIILEPNPDFSPWIRDIFGLDSSEDRFARYRESTIPNPLYLELFL